MEVFNIIYDISQSQDTIANGKQRLTPLKYQSNPHNS